MEGKMFYRERTKIEEGDRMPRFKLVAVSGVDIHLFSKHFRKHELEQIAQAVGADLIELTVPDKGHKFEQAE